MEKAKLTITSEEEIYSEVTISNISADLTSGVPKSDSAISSCLDTRTGSRPRPV